MPETGKLRRAAMALLLTLGASAFASAHAAENVVAEAVADPARPFLDTSRDADRKPAGMVAFSGVKPGDIVAEISPDEGYYTRILSRLVGATGRVYAMVPYMGQNPQFVREQREALIKAGKPVPPNLRDAALAIQDTAQYKNVTVFWENFGQYGGQFSLPEQADVIWTTNNYHDLHNAMYKLNMAAVDKAAFAALKPGGVFFVGDHAAAKGAGFSQTETLHRAEPGAVKAEILAAGFVLDGESKILANPADDHSKHVGELHDKTDQFVLRFKKPATASAATQRPPHGAMNGFYGNTSHSGLGTDSQRWVFYHPDGAYQEFGTSGTRVQSGLWYWDAAGHNCMLHQFPADERGFIVCHDTAKFKKAGETWTQNNGGGDRKYAIEPGIHYPPGNDWYIETKKGNTP